MIKTGELQNRAELGGPESAVVKEDPKAQLKAMRDKLERARVTKDGEEQHCADCFRRGRDAAIRILDEP